jgi:2,5-diketo-D-gluconate reductase A
MVEMQEEGLVRSIGVSNFLPVHVDRLIQETGVTPAVNQIEMHPQWTQSEQRRYDADHGIVTESWSPLRSGGGPFGDTVVTRLAEAHDVTPGQVILRWHVQSGVVPIPYSSNPGRIASNVDVFGFELSTDEMEAMATLDSRDRFGADPLTHEEF